MPIQFVVVRLAPKHSFIISRLFHRLFCWATGLRVKLHGQIERDEPVLFIANHISWLDIPVLGSRLKASFVSKAEVDGMAFAGLLARLQRTIFVERERRHRTGQQRDEMVERLAEGGSLILFPEGTSSNGNSVLPFKTALFGVVEAAAKGQAEPIDLTVQPVTIAYTELNGLPLGRALRGKIAWVGDEEFAPHVKQVLNLGRITATLQFHPPVHLADFKSRKALARHCEEVVKRGLRRANSGRLAPEGG